MLTNLLHERELVQFVASLLNSKKLRKVLSGCLEILPMGGPFDTQTYPRVNLSIFGTTLGYIVPDNHCGLSAFIPKLVSMVFWTVGCGPGLVIEPKKKTHKYWF